MRQDGPVTDNPPLPMAVSSDPHPDDPVEWLSAQLDLDERVALAAIASGADSAAGGPDDVVSPYPVSRPEEEVRPHGGDNPPAVLDLVAAHRAVVAAYRQAVTELEQHVGRVAEVNRAPYWSGSQWGRWRDEVSRLKVQGAELQGRVDGLRLAMGAVAGCYRHRQGWRESWRE